MNVFKGKTIAITGHTGFKGSWLALWCKMLEAKVVGFSLPDLPSSPSLFEIADIKSFIDEHYEGDIRDETQVTTFIQKTSPDILFHLAAQPILLDSYKKPKETIETNLLGTVNVLEAIKKSASLQTAIMITSDKCYQNNENNIWGLREIDSLGGDDPYSASKAMAEIATNSYYKSFFEKTLPIATARAGNIIGGGDFASFRIVPDIVRSFMKNKPVILRNPQSTRTWLYILDLLWGYLILANKTLMKKNQFAGSWNFGSLDNTDICVQTLVEKAITYWGSGSWTLEEKTAFTPHEKASLKLNWEKSHKLLNWKPLYSFSEALKETIFWYKTYSENPKNMQKICLQMIENYMQKTNISIVETISTPL